MKTVINILIPTLYIFKTFGLVFNKITPKGTEKTIFGYFHAFIYATLILFSYYYFKLTKFFFNNKNLIVKFVHTSNEAILFICVFGSILWKVFNQEQFIKLINFIKKYDEHVEYFTSNSGRRNSKYFLIFMGISLISNFLLASIVIYTQSDFIKGLEWIFDYILNFLFFADISMFTGLIILLFGRINYLNTRISSVNLENSKGFNDFNVWKVEDVRELYLSIFCCGEIINLLYGPHFVFWALHIFLSVLDGCHFLGNPATMPFIIILKLTTYMSIKLLILLTFSYAGKLLSDQINLTPLVLLENQMKKSYYFNQDRKENLELFLYMTLEKFNITACGFFDIDIKLFYTVLGTIFSYATVFFNYSIF